VEILSMFPKINHNQRKEGFFQFFPYQHGCIPSIEAEEAAASSLSE